MFIFEIITALLILLHLIDFLIKAIKVLKAKEPAKENQEKHGFSVVICAHNELKNLKKNLHAILEQDYPNFDVTVVLDRCDDGSYDYLQSLFENYPRLKALTINRVPKEFHPKKFGITKAIELTTYDWILLTDADCHPHSLHWIHSFNNLVKSNIKCILGIGPYRYQPGLLGSFIAFECFKTALFYIYATLRGKPYMAVGRNLAYRKEAFFEVNGFGSSRGITGGDDDLLIQHLATMDNCAINLDPRSFTLSEPKSSWRSYLSQKTRHISVGKYYEPSVKLRLFVSNGIHCGMWLSNIILFSFNPNHGPIVIAFGMALAVKGLVSRAVSRRIILRWHLWLFPILDLIYALGLPLIGLRSILIKRVRWN
ncbi:glycosyltransferase [Marinoscillum sp. MHG1-6]|uniref:glycosyltransferase n=1 Tax=Marinoscillum sp. MHG1-6 TaxID=2959627 RepID=UPI0021587353|nr:glycosyltransferase [Marinoscillum sp. MHG1-6]